MCELTESMLRSDIDTMTKHGRLIEQSHPATQDKDVHLSEPLCDECGRWSSTLIDRVCRSCRNLQHRRRQRENPRPKEELRRIEKRRVPLPAKEG